MDVEASVERVLRAGAAAEPAAGLEGRVLHRLAQARVAEESARPGPRMRGAIACACVGLCAAGAWVMRERPALRPEQALVRRGAPLSVAGPRAETREGSGAHRGPSAGTAQGRSLQYVARSVAYRPNGAEVAHVSNSEDDVALHEMRAPSRVAPPEPLSAQERMLVRAARRPAAAALVEADAASEAAVGEVQAARSSEPHDLLAALGKGLFAGMSAAAEE